MLITKNKQRPEPRAVEVAMTQGVTGRQNPQPVNYQSTRPGKVQTPLSANYASEQQRGAPATQSVDCRRAPRVNTEASRRVLQCLNLMPSAGSGGSILRPAGVPRRLAIGSWQPLARDGEHLLVYDGEDLASINTGLSDSTPELIATLDGEPRCALVGDRQLTVMTAASQHTFHRGADGRWVHDGVDDEFPDLTIEAVAQPFVSTIIHADTLERSAQNAIAAYTTLFGQANGAGCFMQPVLVRCRLFDADNNLLRSTMPVLVTPDEGTQLRSPWLLNLDSDGKGADSTVIQANTYFLRIKTVANSAYKKVARVEVQVGYEFHPFDVGGTAKATILRRPTEQWVSVEMPAASRAIGTSATAYRLSQAIANFDSMAVTVASINSPFDSAQNIDIHAPSITNLKEACTALEKVIGEHATKETAMSGGFTAGRVADNGNATLWASVTVRPDCGDGPATFAAKCSDEAWSGKMRIDFADGSYLTRDCHGSRMPLTLWPTLSFPDARAQRLRMCWHAEGSTVYHSIDVTLTANSAGTCSVYVNTSGKPIISAATALDLGDAHIPLQQKPTSVAVTGSGGKGVITAMSDLGSEIIEICAARSGSSAWDFGRARFYAFCADGIRLVTVASDRKSISVTLLSSDSIDNRHCIAQAGDKVLALTNAGIISLSGTSVKLLYGGEHGNRLGYDSATDEIVIADTDDNEATIIVRPLQSRRYAITLEPQGGWLADGGVIYTATYNGVVEVSRRQPTTTHQAVRWTARVVPAGGLRRLPRGIQWMVSGTNVNLHLGVSRAYLDGRVPLPAKINTVHAQGNILSGLRTRLHGHAATELLLTVEGTVSYNFSMTAPILTYETRHLWK